MERGDHPQLMYAWGEGVKVFDGHFLHYVFSVPTVERDITRNEPVIRKSFMEELEERGYDLTTIKFSIQKKRTT
jgi:hypothetical protein